jgi:PmbA/TldA metallopeptidase C-terminal domain
MRARTGSGKQDPAYVGRQGPAWTRFLGISVCLTCLPVSAQESPTLAAMQDEMKRSMAELRMKGEAPPYYIAYEVLDRTMSDVSGRLGAIVENPPRRTRTLRVEVRVGDYTFDSSRFVVQGFGGGGGLSGETVIAPLDDDYDAMRREIWLTTDTAYKRAITMFARKKAAFQNRTASDPIPDFSEEPPVETIVPGWRLKADQRDRAAVVARVQQPSAVFAAYPDVDLSEVAITQIHGTRYYVNSEGSKTVAPIHITSLTMYGEAQAGDGMPVRQTYTEVGRTLADLPPAADLVAKARQIAADVDAARVAPIGEEFAGPVLIDGTGGPQFVAETLTQMMQARRPPDAENPRMAQAPASPFLNRTGLRVMADAFSASDTPSLTHFEGKPLAGSYVVDDEGMRAKDVTLVQKGRLAALLTGRVPQKNFARSNGHGRSNTVLAGVFQVESSQAIPAAELKDKYIALLKAQDKAFGYIVRGVRSDGQGGAAGPGIDSIVKVTLDGRESPVRGMRFGSVSPMAFRDLAEASKERTVFSYRAGATSAVSVIAPSLIFEELEIQRVRDILQKPPVVPSPLKTLNVH